MTDILATVTYWVGLTQGMIGSLAVLTGQPRTLETVALMAGGAFCVAVAAYMKAAK